MSEPAAEPAEPKAAARTSEYHILKLQSSSGADETWSIFARNVEAIGRNGAISKAVTDPQEGDIFVAIPSRSFKPTTATVKVERSVVFE